MGATQSYSALLKRFMNEKMLENEYAKKSYIWQTCDKDASWAGGVYEVPILEAGFSSMSFGALTAQADIAEAQVALGTISAHKELWASLLVREADLFRHGSMEESYLKIMPDRLDAFLSHLQDKVSAHFLNGGGTAYLSANGGATGEATVDLQSVPLFQIGEKVSIDDDNSNEVTGYIRTININTGVMIVYDARTGGAVVDLSGYTTAQNAVIRIVGTGTEKFLSLPEACLPAAVAGGSATLYGKTKADFTTLQSYNESGAGWAAATIVDDLLGFCYNVQKLGRGKQGTALVNYGMFKNIVKGLEDNRRYTVENKKVGYGFKSLTLLGPDCDVEIVALRNMPTNKVYVGDLAKAITFAGKDFFKKKLYNGEEFFMIRETTGPAFITDIALRGDFVVRPALISVAHTVAAAAST
jgi:hypothetical protein